MTDEITGELGLPAIDQISWVVEDLDRALEKFRPLFGEFTLMESELKDTLYRGEPSDVTLRMAFGKSGGVEIELIQVVSGRSPHLELLEKYGEGAHHVRFRVDDVDATSRRLEPLGFETIWYKRMEGGDIVFTYLEGPPGHGGAVIELFQFPESAGG